MNLVRRIEQILRGDRENHWPLILASGVFAGVIYQTPYYGAEYGFGGVIIAFAALTLLVYILLSLILLV